MVYVTPDYYNEFQCIASRCRHSCCAGWEIDIDEETYEQYCGMEGPLGYDLQKHISTEGTPHFILGQDERCPFLNEENLCRLILEAGEECLCEICTEHPRFYHFLPGRTEVGLGLCCEEAARLLLTWDCGVTLLEYDDGVDDGDEENSELLEVRKDLFALAQNRELPMLERMKQMLHYVNYEKLDALLGDVSDWAIFCLGLERLDEAWTTVLEELKNAAVSPEQLFDDELVNGYENLLVYFVHRYVLTQTPQNLALAVAFAVFSTCLIAAVDHVYAKKHGELPLLQRAEHTRLYSSEIEYSDVNVDAILAHIEEKMRS